MMKCKCVISSILVQKKKLIIKLAAVADFTIKVENKQWNVFVGDPIEHAQLVETNAKFTINRCASPFVLEAYRTQKPVYVYIDHICNPATSSYDIQSLELL